jgi:hypothetical protein
MKDEFLFPFKGHKTTGHHQLECHTHTHKVYPQNTFRVQILPLQCCGHDGAHACRVYWSFGKAWTPFAHNRTVCTSSCVFTMFKEIEKPAAYEMWSVIHFLNARNMKLADIHHQLCEVYGEHAMIDSMVRRWVRHVNEGCGNVHYDPQSSRPSVVNEDWWVQWKRRFKRTDDSPFCHCIFHKFHRHFFIKLCLINFVFGNCDHAGCRRCLHKNTK